MRICRIAVAGAGAIGTRHIEETQRCAATTLGAIVDPGPRAAELARRLAVPLYRSLDALLATHRPDGVILATPNNLHVEQALCCVSSGVPVLVEKPLAHSVAEGRRLVEAADRAQVPILVGHHRRHSPILAKAVEVVHSGDLGTIVGVMGSAVFHKPADYFEGQNAWRRHLGAGPILLNLIHEIDNLRAMVGEIVSVQAIASSAIRNFEVEDTVAINLQFANGALGTFLLSDTAASPRSWEQTAQENKAYASYPDEDAYVILGTRGSLAVPTMRLRFHARDEDRSWFTPLDERTIALDRADPLARQVEHFAAVIRGEAVPLVSARDGLQNLRVTDAIATAAREGRSITIGFE